MNIGIIRNLHPYHKAVSSHTFSAPFYTFFWRYYFAVLVYPGTLNSVEIGCFYYVSREPLFVSVSILRDGPAYFCSKTNVTVGFRS